MSLCKVHTTCIHFGLIDALIFGFLIDFGLADVTTSLQKKKINRTECTLKGSLKDEYWSDYEEDWQKLCVTSVNNTAKRMLRDAVQGRKNHY